MDERRESVEGLVAIRPRKQRRRKSNPLIPRIVDRIVPLQEGISVNEIESFARLLTNLEANVREIREGKKVEREDIHPQ
jgi:hypothetical protein